jgi:uncharacterized DUF497 family protein
MDFEWDARKGKVNLQKHGVNFSEASTVFADPLGSTFADPDHSTDEDRYITIGESKNGRVLIVSHTDRNDRVRIISARVATRRERRAYEEA